MRIIVAPDSFKGSATARELCECIRAGIQDADPNAEAILMPMADGGEGTVDNLVLATGGKTIRRRVSDPLGRPVEAAYGVLGDGVTAVIEAAQASGLTLLKPEERNPLLTSSYGTGELILHALEAGYRRFLIGLGGSAVNDGGAGMLRALGMRLLNADGEPLPDGGGALAELSGIDLSGLDPRLAEAEFKMANDVSNPLCGPQGASSVFGPQKGATPEMIRQLDEGLLRYGKVLSQATGTEVAELPGSGAAGGMGAALLSVLKAESRPGIEWVMELTRFEEHLRTADLVITGEGRLDKQTKFGKAIAGICGKARLYDVSVIALCGSLEVSAEEIEEMGLLAAFSVLPGPCSLEDATVHVAAWTRRQTGQILRILLSGRQAVRKDPDRLPRS
ncbi:glycerate kinase [Cohnella candidum]|uniref:Glycerate kinase n=1 Tax=Cohnella candidum TaxID=2674991 RepID=A0A3G3JUZ3_9BACL|nr:glycerate kinase [Cohnella candidum]AYQ72060.1 glycerate kinase [Cohnella candidum]